MLEMISCIYTVSFRSELLQNFQQNNPLILNLFTLRINGATFNIEVGSTKQMKTVAEVPPLN